MTKRLAGPWLVTAISRSQRRWVNVVPASEPGATGHMFVPSSVHGFIEGGTATGTLTLDHIDRVVAHRFTSRNVLLRGRDTSGMAIVYKLAEGSTVAVHKQGKAVYSLADWRQTRWQGRRHNPDWHWHFAPFTRPHSRQRIEGALSVLSAICWLVSAVAHAFDPQFYADSAKANAEHDKAERISRLRGLIARYEDPRIEWQAEIDELAS